MRRITLSLGDRKCRIFVGNNLLWTTGWLITANGPWRKFAVVTNDQVHSIVGKDVAQSLEACGLEHIICMVPDAESAKSLDWAKRLYKKMAAFGIDRDSCVIGLGGGVVGDLAGFVAATYMRGIALVQLPTTLLAQVDSAIGGKTGVNLPEGKNLVGAFHQPELVISDVQALAMQSREEFASGLAEVLKYGMISDPKLFSLIEKEAARLVRHRDGKRLAEVVARCSAIKARLVEADERDHCRRLVLNYGHTLGHALEAASKYEGYRHGEAIALGMLFAARVSVKLDMMEEGDLKRLTAAVFSLGLPVKIGRRLKAGKLLEFMRTDKKGKGGRLRLVLPQRIGRAVVSDAANTELLLETLEEMRG